MKANILIKSLAYSHIAPTDFSVATLYKGQSVEKFLADNFAGKIREMGKSIKELTTLDYRDFFVIHGTFLLVTPDGESSFDPDYVYQLEDDSFISLYMID